MKFHLPSFALGYAAGYGTHLVGTHLRPLFLEVATSAYKLLDAVVARTATNQEGLEDLLAEARARARKAVHVPRPRPAPAPTSAEA